MSEADQHLPELPELEDAYDYDDVPSLKTESDSSLSSKSDAALYLRPDFFTPAIRRHVPITTIQLAAVASGTIFLPRYHRYERCDEAGAQVKDPMRELKDAQYDDDLPDLINSSGELTDASNSELGLHEGEDAEGVDVGEDEAGAEDYDSLPDLEYLSLGEVGMK